MATTDFRQRIGSLHNGISTQSASSRFPSQVEDAENALFSVTNGVSTRAGSRHHAFFTSGTFDQGLLRAHRIIRDSDERYMVVYGRGDPGIDAAISSAGGSTTGNFSESASWSGGVAPVVGQVQITIVSGDTITFDNYGSNNQTFLRIIDLANPRNRTQYVVGPASGTFTLTFGGQTTSSIAFNATAAAVQSAIAALSTVGSSDNVSVTRAGSGPYTYTVVFADYLTTQTLMTNSNGSVTGTVIIPTLNAGVQTYLNSGTPSADDLRLLTIVDTTIICNTKVTTDTGTKSGFSTADTKIDETKFPVLMRRTALNPTAFAISAISQTTELKAANTDGGDWKAPLPFRDHYPISDMAYHRGRLCLAMNDYVVTSQPGDLFNFFPYSSTTFAINAADPIVVQIGANQVSFIDFMVPFRKSLLILTRAGSQFELGGDEIFTGTNATFVPSTNYSTQRVRPLPLSSVIYMAGTQEQSSILYEYVYDDIQVSNRANNITNHVFGLLPKNIRTLTGSDNSDTIVVVPKPTATDFSLTIESFGKGFAGYWSDTTVWLGGLCPVIGQAVVIISQGDTVIFDKYPNSDGSLFIYRSMRAQDKIIQSAWSRYSFGNDIINDAICVEDTMFVLRKTTSSGQAGMAVDSMSLSIDPAAPPSFPELPRLDHRHLINSGTYVSVNGVATMQWTLPYSDLELDTATVIFDNNSVLEYRELPVTVSGTTASAASEDDLSTKLCVLGRSVAFRLELTRLYQVDGNGNPIIEGELEVNKVVVDHAKSGPYIVTAESTGRQPRQSVFTPQNDFIDTQGRFSAWCIGRSNDLRIGIRNSDSRPCVLTGIEYYGRHTSMLHGRQG